MEPNPQHGEQFLHSRDSKLQSSLSVELEQIHREQAGETPETKPVERIADWMDVLKQTHESHGDDPRVLERIKTSYHKEYVIHPEDVPESTFLLEARIAREQGHGDIEITPQYREAKTAEIVANQEQSLDKWVDYLTSGDATYPMWAKYWAFTSMTKMGKFEKTIDKDEHEHARFAKRSPDTTAPFPPLNPRALALVVDAIDAKAKQRILPKAARSEIENTSTTLSDQEFKQLLSGESFSELYTQFLVELPEYSAEGLRETRGDWVKYEQGSDPQPLVDSLEGHPLEWCTAGYETARTQLQAGDFYVYYSLDDKGLAKIPRVAIRMKQERIAEVRGIRPHQELDPFIGDVVQAKMEEFPDGKKYQQRAKDMKRVTRIDEAVSAGILIADDDLKFICEFDRKIQGFGYSKDPRINEIKYSDAVLNGLSKMLGYEGEKVSFDKKTALRGYPESPVRYHIGDLDLSYITSAEDLTLPTTVTGDLDLSSLTSAEGLTLPEAIDGSLYLSRLTSAEDLTLPTTVTGDLDLSSLTTTEGLMLPETINGDIRLASLTSAEGLILPATINGDLNLASLTSAEGLAFPKTVTGDLLLTRLASLDGLTLPETINGNLDLNRAVSAEGLVLPETIGGELYLGGLTTAKDLTFPKTLEGNLYLKSLVSADGVTLPETVTGDINLSGLTSAEDLTFPKTVTGDIDLSRLISAEGVTLPEVVNGNLDLLHLTSAAGLSFPKTINGFLDLYSLTSAEGLVLPKTVMGDLDLSSLASVEGLTFPETVNNGINLGNLVYAEGLTLPQNLNGVLSLTNVTSAEGLILPSTFSGEIHIGPSSYSFKYGERPKIWINGTAFAEVDGVYTSNVT